jgi:hypothetical protein
LARARCGILTCRESQQRNGTSARGRNAVDAAPYRRSLSNICPTPGLYGRLGYTLVLHLHHHLLLRLTRSAPHLLAIQHLYFLGYLVSQSHRPPSGGGFFKPWLTFSVRRIHRRSLPSACRGIPRRTIRAHRATQNRLFVLFPYFFSNPNRLIALLALFFFATAIQPGIAPEKTNGDSLVPFHRVPPPKESMKAF